MGALEAFIPLLVGGAVAWRGLKKGSLSMDGALTAFVVGSTMLSTELRVFGITMLVFYFAGSRATRVGKELKAKLEDGVREGAGQRDAVQVCSSKRLGIECPTNPPTGLLQLASCIRSMSRMEGHVYPFMALRPLHFD
jgi:uncharacterized membrane protein